MRGWPIVRTILCVIGAATVVVGAGLAACIAGLAGLLPPSGDVQRHVYPSPDATMNAVVATRVCGGAISPYRTSSVAVVRGGPDASEDPDAADDVFVGDCSALPDGDRPDAPASPPAVWRDAATLQVRIRADGTSIRMRDRDRTGRIKVVFVFATP
ncbi:MULTISPECIES: hypothetical protein [Methylobacterium]|uniref:hypothetical protein n=1 Tax=Methylobacterium TaxID=407 RepID=UPI0013ED8CF5|nr:hypothetical protein [Methylobacterium sp. DB0501]NGM33698.1 hypothetical protein [Methylobacterium sp. DB0501]